MITQQLTATNGIGWSVEFLSSDGWKPVMKLNTKEEAEAFLAYLNSTDDPHEHRVYESLSENPIKESP
jgi:hypothetical protein